MAAADTVLYLASSALDTTTRNRGKKNSKNNSTNDIVIVATNMHLPLRLQTKQDEALAIGIAPEMSAPPPAAAAGFTYSCTSCTSDRTPRPLSRTTAPAFPKTPLSRNVRASKTDGSSAVSPCSRNGTPEQKSTRAVQHPCGGGGAAAKTAGDCSHFSRPSPSQHLPHMGCIVLLAGAIAHKQIAFPSKGTGEATACACLALYCRYNIDHARPESPHVPFPRGGGLGGYPLLFL